MDALKRTRTIHRTAFTRTLSEMNAILERDELDKDQIAVVFELLEEKMTDLDKSSRLVLDAILSLDVSVDIAAIFESEGASTDEYRKRFLAAKRTVTKLLEQTQVSRGSVLSSPISVHQNNRKTFQLPKIEIVKFSGNVRDWLMFWNQFRKIHEDPDIDAEDKFQHLIQSMETKSRAYELVSSFPPTRENYENVIASLKNRFGRDELQVEVYVRELLSLVLNNVVRGKDKVSLVTLYDKLEAHMRALETLGVTSDKCAAMLYPLVESSLPEDILRVWQRLQTASNAKDSKTRLTKLMEFLCAEVENEERISMAVAGFSFGVSEKSKRQKVKEDSCEVATAVELLTIQEKKILECIFCEKSDHDSQNCYKAKKLSLKERRVVVKELGNCFNCLKPGHNYKHCRSKVKCGWCCKKHVLLMCPGQVKYEGSESGAGAKIQINDINNFASLSSAPEIYLQTLCVKMVNGSRECVVRVLIDSGSQRSYLAQEVARKLNYTPIQTRQVSHSLFGGTRSEPQSHKVFLVRVKNLRDNYTCDIEAMDQKIICDDIARIKPAEWVQELRDKGVHLSDIGEGKRPVDLLIGADVAGKLLTGRKIDLDNGLTAVETHLGWTIMGKNSTVQSRY
ncbi:uncharacterized protein LOC122512885 [Leptopilina heterotoma]|uniref:uncharacterized protein LOC122512885 n=1 Tax=Leptopilina heterotoma TaxID=63436 RepID=UPI001CA7F04D|nr:uncharacterized protein LOC122512885 [Leptopilina heterotoma]